MTSQDRLKKLSSGGYEFKNPYTENFKTKEIPKPVIKNENSQKGIMDYEGHMLGRLMIMQNEIDSLKFDILTLLNIIEENFNNMTILSAKEKYFNFRADPSHVLNRITDKLEAIHNNKMNINGNNE